MTDKPDERKAVPREATEAMLHAAMRAEKEYGDDYLPYGSAWRVMFDAAPVLATAPAEPPKDGAYERAAQIAESQPFYPDTITGMRQQWVKEQIAAKIRALNDATAVKISGAPLPTEKAPGPSNHIVDVNEMVGYAGSRDTTVASPPPSGEVAALIEQLEAIQPGFDGCVTGHALAQKAAAMLRHLNPTLPDTLPGQCPRCGEFARLSAPVPEQSEEIARLLAQWGEMSRVRDANVIWSWAGRAAKALSAAAPVPARECPDGSCPTCGQPMGAPL